MERTRDYTVKLNGEELLALLEKTLQEKEIIPNSATVRTLRVSGGSPLVTRDLDGIEKTSFTLNVKEKV